MVRLRLLPLPDRKNRKPPMQRPKLLRTPEPARDIVQRSAAVRGIPGTLPAEGRREQEPELETLPARARAALALVTERAVAEQGGRGQHSGTGRWNRYGQRRRHGIIPRNHDPGRRGERGE